MSRLPNTHAGTAKSYRDQAAVSKNDAAGSATAAATSAGVAVDAQKSAIALSRNPNFQFGKEGWKAYNTASVPLWDTVTVVPGVTGGKALKFSGDNLWFMTDNMIPVDTNRTYKMTIRVKAEGGLTRIYAGAITYDANGDLITGGAGSHRYFCANSRHIYAVDGWVTVSGTITGEGNNHGDFRPGTSLIRPVIILQYNDSTATAALIDEVTFEDVEESTNAAGHASAASTSASSAAASADSAGQSASSAQASKNSAETARSQALTYRNEAATSSTTALSAVKKTLPSDFADGDIYWSNNINKWSDDGGFTNNGTVIKANGGEKVCEIRADANSPRYVNNAGFIVPEAGRKYRVTVEARQSTGVLGRSQLQQQTRVIKASDGNYKTSVGQGFVFDAIGTWKTFVGPILTVPSNPDDWGQLRALVWTTSNGNSGDRFEVRTIVLEDVTESHTAAQSASAAAIVEGVVTKTLGSENFSNPVFRTWKTSPNMPHGFGDVQINANNRYFSKVPGKYYVKWSQFFGQFCSVSKVYRV